MQKVAMISGASRGIGREITEELARRGYLLSLGVRSPAGLYGHLDSLVFPYEARNPEAGRRWVDATVERFGRIDVLISNAGIQIISAIVDFKYEDWKKLMAIHADGAFLTTRAAMRAMIKQGKGGSIIYMGSVHSHEASPLKSAYVTAKHGLIGLAKTVAKEGAKDRIRANVICPGFVRTPLVEKQIPEQAKALGISEADVVKNVMLKDTVDGEFTTVQDVAELAVFLAAFPTNALTGQSITVSHGWHMQ